MLARNVCKVLLLSWDLLPTLLQSYLTLIYYENHDCIDDDGERMSVVGQIDDEGKQGKSLC